MSTTSPILNLTLPASDGSDPFSLADDFLANWAILDGAPGVFICTSDTHPTWGSGQSGRLIFETDTDNLLEWNGSNFVAPNLTIGNLVVSGTVEFSGTVSGDINMDGNRLDNLSNGSGQQAATASQLDAAIAGVAIADIGSVGTELYNVVQEINYGMSFTAPDPTIYAGLVAHAPSSGTVFIPLTTLAPGDGIVANFGQDITTAGDANATWSVSCVLVVWDAAGTNYLQATGSLSAVDSSTGDQYLTLTQVTLVGSDLSIQANGGGGDNITTAAGGAYNVLLQTETVWF